MRLRSSAAFTALLVGLLALPAGGAVAAAANDRGAPEPRPEAEPGALPQATDNVSAALAWSSLFADGSAPDVLLARDDAFADALSSGGLQGLRDAPLLLTGSGALDERVQNELARLGAQRVTILGGTNAVSQAVEDSLTGNGYQVTRLSGATRLETAVAVATAGFADATTAIVARAFAADGATDPTQAFADSLAAGGAAASSGFPILLSETGQLSEATRTYLAGSAIEAVYLVGGTGALSQQVEDDLTALAIEVIRLSGATRFDTAEALTFEFYGSPDVFLLVEGQADDAWAGGFSAASAAESSPILLSNGDDLPLPTLEAAAFGVQSLCGPQTAPLACERAATAATSAQFDEPGNFVAALSGAAEVPGPGDDRPGVSGDAFVSPTVDPAAICYELITFGLSEPVVAAHIHRGPAGVAGDVEITLVPPVEDFPGTAFVRTCAFDLDEALVAEIFANPAEFYVNLHTATFPAGAVRGQLFLGEIIAEADLTGAAEVPGPGDPTGDGYGLILTDAADHSQLCYYLEYTLEEAPIAGHIHVGGPEVAGDVVHPLIVPEFLGAGALSAGTFCESAGVPLVESFLADPGGFYVNLHTATFPAGAIRGQLVGPIGTQGPTAR